MNLSRFVAVVGVSVFCWAHMALAAPPATKTAKPAEADKAAAPAEGDAAAAAPAAPAEPNPGVLVLDADVEGLKAVLTCAGGTRTESLSKGPNQLKLPPCEYAIAVTGKDGKEVGSYTAQVTSDKEIKVEVKTVGAVQLDVRDGSSLEIDGKKVAPKSGKASKTVSGGAHSVVVRKPGFYGSKSQVEVTAGQTLQLDPTFERYVAPRKGLAWAGIIGGSTLVLTAVLLEALVPAEELGGDITRWAVMGVGVTGFVGGTILMKEALAKENNPPVRAGAIPSKTALSSGAPRARFTMRF